MWDAIAVSLLILDAIIDIIDWSFVAYIFFDLRKRENIYCQLCVGNSSNLPLKKFQ